METKTETGTETRRTMVVCRTSSEGPGCGSRWVDMAWEKRPHHVGHGMYARTETVLRIPSGRRCPICGGSNVRFQLLEVKRNHGGKCQQFCQTSDSRKCGCACGGKKHGIALDPFMVHVS